MKRDSFVIALLCSVFISGLLYALCCLLPHFFIVPYILLVVIGAIIFIVTFITYYVGVSLKIKRITTKLSNPPYLKSPSLNDLGTRTIGLLNERKEELEKIERLEKHRQEFLGNISHEMKTPLFHIQGYLSTLLENKVEDMEMVKRYLDKSNKSTERLIRIVEDLDTISELEIKEFSEEVGPFDIVELCRDVLESEEIDAAKKSIAFVLLNEKAKMAVVGDKFRIRQVLVNLIVNSIRYGKEGGETRIRLKNDRDLVLIEVADNGIGIDAEHLPRLFERFYRVDKGRSRDQGGTGLGLSIVKHILEAHHQTIEVMSTPGVGSVFSFRLRKSPQYSSFSVD